MEDKTAANCQVESNLLGNNLPDYVPDMNALAPDGSDTDSDCQYKYVFPLRHEITPSHYLKFILTVWYCPETSAAIAGKLV